MKTLLRLPSIFLLSLSILASAALYGAPSLLSYVIVFLIIIISFFNSRRRNLMSLLIAEYVIYVWLLGNSFYLYSDLNYDVFAYGTLDEINVMLNNLYKKSDYLEKNLFVGLKYSFADKNITPLIILFILYAVRVLDSKKEKSKITEQY